jgi:hypothetical protein
VQHCTPEQLALAALREPLPDRDTEHLADCAQCRDEVTSLQRAVDLLAVPSFAEPVSPVPPPPRVWDAIAGATGVTVAPRPLVSEAPVEPVPLRAVPRSTPEDAPRHAPAADLPRPRRGGSTGPSRRWLAIAAALVVGGVVGAGAVALTGERDDGGAVVAQTALDPLDDDRASGRAEVRERAGAGRVLEVDLDAPELDDAYYEVWLLQSDAQRMVQVGVVQRGATVLPLPEGIDLGAYPLVDVSVEPLDGVPTHSGDSVARGQLDT